MSRVFDPFLQELERHGMAYSFGQCPGDARNRNQVRRFAEGGCRRCQRLIEAFDAELANAFVRGTGPFSGMSA